jgi:plasmid stability protein
MSGFSRLSAESMRTISGQWLRGGPARAVLERHPKGAALLPDIEEAHRALCDAMGGDDAAPLEAQLARLREEGAALDARHDRKYRGSWMLLAALIELADDDETVAALAALRDTVHPKGLTLVNAAWSAEAGNAETVRGELDKGLRARLRAIASTEGRTLDDEVQAWLKAGESLGPLTAQKASLEVQIARPAAVSAGAALNAARHGWIKTARALSSNLDLVKGLTAEERAAVLGLLQQSAAAAERGAARRASDDAQPPTPPTGPVTG